MRVESITPEPADAIVEERDIHYTFPVRSGADVINVSFTLTPDAMGTVSGSVRAGDSSVLRFSQFLYP